LTPTEEIVYGIWPVTEAIKSGKEFNKVLLQQNASKSSYTDLMKILREYKIPFTFTPVEKLNKLVKGNHQGVIGFITPVSYHSIENIIPYVYEKGETPFVLILDRITDVRNFGSIARTAECAGVHAVIIPEKESATITTSAGALMQIPVCKVKSMRNAITYLKDSGIKIISCSEKSNKVVYETDLNIPCAIVMGSEEDGISADILKNSDDFVKIPMAGNTSSLNVAVSTGIILFEVLRQRER
jgi:23S rRNA (guanosine2251-2'-O)-methyltransferase